MKPHIPTLLAAVAATAMLATPVSASDGDVQQKPHHHQMHKAKKAKSKYPAIKAYIKANEKMHRDMMIAYSGDADVDFSRGMIPHHQGAVDMAEIALQYGKDAEIRELAQRIIVWQEAEIGMMQAWLAGRDSTWRAENAESLESVKQYMAGMEKMHRDMNIDYTGNADIDFARGMIPHHQGAIDMAWTLKAYGKDPMLRKLADDVIRGQEQEIRLMQNWLAKQPQLPIVKKKSMCHMSENKKAKHGHAHH